MEKHQWNYEDLEYKLKRLILLKDYYSQDMFWELKKIGLYPNSHLKEYQDNLEQEYDRIRTK